MKLLTYQILLTTTFILFQSNDSFCQQVTSKKTIRSKTGLNDLDAKIAEWQKDLNIPNVAISIIENDRVVKSNVYGNLSNGKPAPKNMIFEVASITKVVFSTLVLKLVQKGEWDLDEPLAKYFY
jgi:CubicO group peptidase (beta-lactamase class C family)